MESTLHAFLLYKFGVIVIGAFVVYLGYKLLLRGAFESTSDIQINIAGHSVALSRAAPGSLFALFGAAIIIAAIWMSTFTHITPDGSEQTVNAAMRLPQRETDQANPIDALDEP